MDSEYVEVLEITVVGIRSPAVSNLLRQPHLEINDADYDERSDHGSNGDSTPVCGQWRSLC